ncbi:hypothetical protein [Umezawaea sp. NPDC059074]|uniref:hypothetical protein n=1 Tax=Umezawaea sp. NPDC059074 TaxID=3346716 RepID=UPI0036CF60AC
MTGRKAALFAVMGGALVLTINGEVRAVEPMLGPGFGIVLAAVFAVSTLLALNYVIDGTGPVRRWAWAVLLFAGGMELGLNTWHAVTSVLHGPDGAPVLVDGLTVPALPLGAAVAVGAGPVLLAGLLSHLVSLAMTEEQRAAVEQEAERTAARAARVPARPTHTAYRVAGTEQGSAFRTDSGTALDTSHRTALPAGADTTSVPAPAAAAVPTKEPQYRPAGTATTGTEVDSDQGSTDPTVTWGTDLWQRAITKAREYHAANGSHVRVDDMQALGIGRNRAVALRRDVLAHLLSHPAA